MIVDLRFVLLEDVTPRIFAQKVALACAHRGAIREGEGVASLDLPYYLFKFAGYVPFDLQGDGRFIQVPNIVRVDF